MISAEISTRLTALSLITTGFSVYRNYQPDNPDKIIALMETEGMSPDLFLGSSATQENPGLQIVVRGPQGDADTPRLQIERIYQAMVGWGAFSTVNVRYAGTNVIQSPFLFKRDGNERVYWAFNVIFTKALSGLA
jgi:hypothetical protein